MSNNIFEELPSRKGGDAKPMGDAAASIEKRARQLVYDARYEVKKMLAGKKADPATQERMVLQRIAKSTAIPAVKTRAKQMISKKAAVAEDFIPTIEDAASSSVAKAMFKVFVEGVEEVIPDYLEELRGLDDKKYKIRVTDPKTGNSYVRYGTREKITQLRAKGLKVEMTEYGDPREGERKRGEDTARATGGGRRERKRLDPVGKEDGDLDNDGDKDKSDAYLMKRRKAIGAAIKNRNTVSASYEPEGKLIESKHKKTKKTKAPRWQDSDGDGKWYEPGEDVRKEDFLWTEGTDSTEGQNKNQITGKNVDNYASGAIKISPEDGSQSDMKGPKNVYAHTELEGEVLTEKAKSRAQQRFMAMVYATKKGKKPMSPEVAAAAKGMTKKEAKKFAKTKHKGLPEKVAEAVIDNKDSRDDKAYREVIKNKFRALGAKNPLVMGDPEDLEKTYNKIATSDMIKGKEDGMCEGLVTGTAKAINAVLKPVNQTPKEGEAAVQNLTRNMDVVAKPVKSAIKAVLSVGTQKNQQMLNKRRPAAAQAARMENVESDAQVVEQEDKERRGTDYRGRDYGTGKQNKTIPPEGVMQGGWLEREKLKKA